MSTKSKARKARRHPEASKRVSSPQSLRGEQRVAAAAIAGALLNVATLGVIEKEVDRATIADR